MPQLRQALVHLATLKTYCWDCSYWGHDPRDFAEAIERENMTLTRPVIRRKLDTPRDRCVVHQVEDQTSLTSKTGPVPAPALLRGGRE